MFLFNPGSNKLRYSPKITINDGQTPPVAHAYPGPMLRELPYFPNQFTQNEPKPNTLVGQLAPDNLQLVGEHFSTIDHYAQDDPTTSFAWQNSPYWRYTGYWREPSQFLLVDCTDSRLLSMSLSLDSGGPLTCSIGAVNSGKLLFQRNDGEDYSNTDNQAFGGSPDSNVAKWIRYRPIYNITTKQEINFDESQMCIRFSYWNQRVSSEGGADDNVSPPCWHIIFSKPVANLFYPMYFLPVAYYNVFDGATDDLRKWYSTPNPTFRPPNTPINGLGYILATEANPPQVGPIRNIAQDATYPNAQSHGHLSPFKETSFVLGFLDYTSGVNEFGGYVSHSPNTAASFPHIKVQPTTL